MVAVLYTRRATKDLAALPRTVETRVQRGIAHIGDNPLVGKKLQGPLAKYRSLRVGEYRIIYLHDRKAKTVAILTAGPRGGAYH